MSIVASNLSTSSTNLAGKTAGTSGKAEVSGAGNGDFNNALISLLLGDSNPLTGNSSSLLGSLVQLAGNANAEENTGDSSDGAKLALDLLQGIDQLDESISADPSLVGMLQGWIQQVMTLLTGSDPNQSMNGTVQGQTDQELPLLAQKPETLRFAVQDALTQLVSKLTKNDAATPAIAGDNSFSTAAEQLINSLQNMVAEPKSNDQTDKPVNQLAEKPQAGSVLLSGQQQSTDASKTGGQPSQDQANGGNGSTSENKLTHHSEIKVQEKAGTVANASNEVVKTSQEKASVEATEDSSVQSEPNNNHVVTAGQLQMRDAGNVTVKAQNPVPVQQFANEMKDFVVNKLEIVKLHGISEAKISLTPEHLGQVDVKITLHNGQLVAQFITEHAFAKDSLEQQMAQLRSALQSQGLQVEKLEVTQNSSLSSHMYHDGRQSGNGAQQRQNGKRREVASDEEGLKQLDTLEEWNQWVREANTNTGGDQYGSSFVAKA